MKTRSCPRCKTAKPLEEFYSRSGSYCRVCARQISMDWRARYPEKRRAHVLIRRALKYGELKKPDNCEKCGKQTYLIGHHPDYKKPLEVFWVCSKCHGAIHAVERLHEKKDKRMKTTNDKRIMAFRIQGTGVDAFFSEAVDEDGKALTEKELEVLTETYPTDLQQALFEKQQDHYESSRE